MTVIKKLKDIYPGYFQKSRVFLYPFICNKKSSITPIQTYVSWEEYNISPSDMKLVCMFHLRSDPEFISFEERILLNNPLFEDYKEVEDDKAVYIFDLSSEANDWLSFMGGQYSELSEKQKKRIRDYCGINTANYAFIHSYLYPEKYFSDYAKFLTCRKEDRLDMELNLMKVGQLCDKPNFEKELLKISVKALDFKDV